MVRAGLLMLALGACTSKPPPVLGELPAFELTDQEGAPFGSEQLRGRVWVANFIFTRCPTICPAFTAKMAELQRRSEGLDWRLVSFSVDPEYDTPSRMRAFGVEHGADFGNWSFLTGPLDRIRSVVVDNFKIAMGKNPEVADEVAAIFHGTHFVLVDEHMRIRAYHDNDDSSAVDDVLRDARALVTARGAR